MEENHLPADTLSGRLPHPTIAAALAGRERTQCAARPMPAWMPASRDSAVMPR